MTFKIITLGCKVNIYESEIMREKLEKANYIYQGEGNTDITIINTCTVTNMADKKSQKIIRRIKRENPKTILVVAGCSSENKQDIYKQLEIDILLGNQEKSKIVELIQEYQLKKAKITRLYQERNTTFENMSIEQFKSHTRAFLKIQDGCDNFCSYCIIPYVRGKNRSKDFKTTIKEANELIANGHSEIVLTGIHTGSYGLNTKHDLTDLIKEMSKNEKLKRIRISSIEITELNDKFLKELKENPKICNHLHIPLQAGSDEILKKMNRKYNLEYFENKIATIRKIRPDISITTDIIVGFPTETEELFQKTLETAKKLKFSKIHAFPYSIRENTPAATMPHQIEEKIKKERNTKLIALSEELEKEYLQKFIGKTKEVLLEEIKDEYAIGHTDNYLKVIISNTNNIKTNTFYNVKIIEIEKNNLIGEIAK